MTTPAHDPRGDPLSAEERCAVVIVYQGGRSRQQACTLCAHLKHRFRDELAFEFTWWKLKFLSDPQIGLQAAHAAAIADVILFSTESDAELAPEIIAWAELWVTRRSRREGALAAIHSGSQGAAASPTKLDPYLKAIAQRTGMDYLPSGQPSTLQDSPEQLQKRAAQSTSTLDSILDHSPPPSHWGINE